MVAGILFTSGYIINFKFLDPASNTAEHWLFGISPEGIGFVGMIINFAIAITVMKFTAPPPRDIVELTESIRYPRGAKEAHEMEL
jgi:cation/acetate symporter